MKAFLDLLCDLEGIGGLGKLPLGGCCLDSGPPLLNLLRLHVLCLRIVVLIA